MIIMKGAKAAVQINELTPNHRSDHGIMTMYWTVTFSACDTTRYYCLLIFDHKIKYSVFYSCMIPDLWFYLYQINIHFQKQQRKFVHDQCYVDHVHMYTCT